MPVESSEGAVGSAFWHPAHTRMPTMRASAFFTSLWLLLSGAALDCLAVVSHLRHSQPSVDRCQHDHGSDRDAILPECPFGIETESEYQHVAVPEHAGHIERRKLVDLKACRDPSVLVPDP